MDTINVSAWLSYGGLACCVLVLAGFVLYRWRKKPAPSRPASGPLPLSLPKRQPGKPAPYVYSADHPWGLLVYRNGKFLGQELALKRSIVSIGREEDNEVWLDDDTISRYHAELVWHQGQLYLTDNGSLNGVLLNGQRIRNSVSIKSGDILEIGSHRFELKYSSLVSEVSDPLLPQLQRISRNRDGAIELAPASKGSLSAPTVALQHSEEEVRPFADEEAAEAQTNDISRQPTSEMPAISGPVQNPSTPVPPSPPRLPQPLRLPSRFKQ